MKLVFAFAITYVTTITIHISRTTSLTQFPNAPEEGSMNIALIIGTILAAIAGLTVLTAILFRVVVSTNDVHIVQSGRSTVSYGKDQTAGNTYYKWPAWMPLIGVKTVALPVSVFDVELDAYAAYDQGRVPFVVDVMAFFRIDDSNVAAQRVHSFSELLEQLKSILQGAVRSILASSEIEEILEGRSKFGHMFTEAVDGQLKAWGVCSVKAIELMDIRDAHESKVIDNIMAKKKSLIEMQSRVAVAANHKTAQMAEIEAQREVDLGKQEALQQVGIRTAEKDRTVGISNQQALQSIKEQEKVTTEKAMAVTQVQMVRTAEIEREVQVVAAEQEKRTAVIKAEGEKQRTVTVAEGNLAATKLEAEGIEAQGAAKAEAEKAMQLAPVQAQITLAKEIGANQGYQSYLVSIRKIEADQTVGVEQAQALTKADIKVIANTGHVVDGVSDVMQLFTSKGGTQVGAALEALAQTEVGAGIVDRLRGRANGPRT